MTKPPLGTAPGGTAGSGVTPPPINAGTAGMPGMKPDGMPAPSASGPGGMPSNLPMAKEPCQDFVTGTMTFLNIKVQIWAGRPAPNPPGGPLLFYWHGTGTVAQEAQQGFGMGINQAVAEGGIVASFIDTTSKGLVTGGTIWYADDLLVADQIVACAIEKQKIDTRRIHSSGYSAGGLQTGAMLTQRANYVASGLIYSGGVIAPGGAAGNVPALMCAHGAKGMDTLGLDFADGCEKLETQTVMKGGFAVDCNDGGTHIDVLNRFAPANFGYKFLMTHPYGTKPSPWMGMLPGDAPMTCKIWKP